MLLMWSGLSNVHVVHGSWHVEWMWFPSARFVPFIQVHIIRHNTYSIITFIIILHVLYKYTTTYGRRKCRILNPNSTPACSFHSSIQDWSDNFSVASHNNCWEDQFIKFLFQLHLLYFFLNSFRILISNFHCTELLCLLLGEIKCQLTFMCGGCV